MPCLTAFNYVIVQRLFSADYQIQLPILNQYINEIIYFILIPTILVQLFWVIQILIKTFSGRKFHQLRMVFTMLQIMLIYGLATNFSNMLSFVIILEDFNVQQFFDIQFYQYWSSVCLAVNWFLFLIFMTIFIKYMFKKKNIQSQKQLG